MEINTNISAAAVNRTVDVRRTPNARTELDEASFEGSDVLESALEKLPESRAEAIARARTLIGDVHYPPDETIRKISHLLAIHLDTP